VVVGPIWGLLALLDKGALPESDESNCGSSRSTRCRRSKRCSQGAGWANRDQSDIEPAVGPTKLIKLSQAITTRLPQQ
jgi:hypothetical protein